MHFVRLEHVLCFSLFYNVKCIFIV